jgi:hypothetical protein
MKKLIIFSISNLIIFSVYAETMNLTNKCIVPLEMAKNINKLQAFDKIDGANEQAEMDKDYLKVVEKGRLYFHSLPHENCKTDIFIIKGDTDQIIDAYPEDDLSFTNNYARVIFYSKIMKRDIVGWVKMAALNRLTESEKNKK